MLNFILKIYNLLKIKPLIDIFSPQNSSVIYNYVFLCYRTVFKLFKNHKNQRSADCVEFHIENLQSAKNQTGLIFFHLKIAQLYIIMYFYVI